MLAYILPVLAFFATLIVVYKEHAPSNKKNIITVLAILVALGSLVATEWRIHQDKLSAKNTTNELTQAREELQTILTTQENISETNQINHRTQLCQIHLNEIENFSLLVGLLRNGYTEHKNIIPSKFQVENFAQIKQSGTYNGTVDEMMMTAIKPWPQKIYGRDPYREFAKFHEIENKITELKCTLAWKTTPYPSYGCECS